MSLNGRTYKNRSKQFSKISRRQSQKLFSYFTIHELQPVVFQSHCSLVTSTLCSLIKNKIQFQIFDDFVCRKKYNSDSTSECSRLHRCKRYYPRRNIRAKIRLG